MNDTFFYESAWRYRREKMIWHDRIFRRFTTRLIMRHITHGIQLAQVPPFCKVSTKTRLRATCCDSAQSSKNARKAQQDHPWGFWQGRGEAIKYHCRVIEDICRKSIHLTLWFERRTEPVCKEDGCYPTHALLEDGQKKCSGGRGCSIAHSHTCRLIRQTVFVGSILLLALVPSSTALDDSSPAIELEKACSES